MPSYALKCPGYSYAAVETYAASGTIFTQYFGEPFDPELLEKDVELSVQIHPINEDDNTTLHIDFEKISLTYLSSGYDELSLQTNTYLLGWKKETILDERFGTKNYTPPISRVINFRRKVIKEDVRRQKLDQVPGFKISWHYSDRELKSSAKYSDMKLTKLYAR